MFKHLLLPTDGSEASLRAVEKGAELARALGAEATVMTVMEIFHGGILGSALDGDETNFQEGARAAAQARLDAAEKMVMAAGVPCHRILSTEHVIHKSILDAAESARVDLIVMGTHGIGGLPRLFVRSETERVLAHTTIAVLTLH